MQYKRGGQYSTILHFCGFFSFSGVRFFLRNQLVSLRTFHTLFCFCTAQLRSRPPTRVERRTGVGRHFHGETWLVKLLETSFAIVLYGLLMCVTLKVSTYAASTVDGGGGWYVPMMMLMGFCRERGESFFFLFSEFVWESVTNRPQTVKNCMETGHQKVKIFHLQKCMRPVWDGSYLYEN